MIDAVEVYNIYASMKVYYQSKSEKSQFLRIKKFGYDQLIKRNDASMFQRIGKQLVDETTTIRFFLINLFNNPNEWIGTILENWDARYHRMIELEKHLSQPVLTFTREIESLPGSNPLSIFTDTWQTLYPPSINKMIAGEIHPMVIVVGDLILDEQYLTMLGEKAKDAYNENLRNVARRLNKLKTQTRFVYHESHLNEIRKAVVKIAKDRLS